MPINCKLFCLPQANFVFTIIKTHKNENKRIENQNNLFKIKELIFVESKKMEHGKTIKKMKKLEEK